MEEQIKIDTLGLRFISSLLEEKTFEPVLGRVEEADLHGLARTAYRFLRKYVDDNETWPGPSIIEDLCKAKLPEPKDPLSDMVALLDKRKVRKLVSDEGKRVDAALDRGNPHEALRLLQTAGDRIDYQPNKRLITLTESRDARAAEYDASKLLPDGLEGIVTPWAWLNNAIGGYANGEYIVVVARTSVGKSWYCLLTANKSLDEGKRVLVVSMEMPVKHLLERLDALRYGLPYRGVKKAQLDSFQEQTFKQKLQDDKSITGDIFFAGVEDVTYVSDIADLVKRHSIDIVVLDGCYRLKSTDRGADGYNSLRLISMELQTTAMRTNVPWVCTTQYGAADEKGKKTDVGQEMNLYSVRWARDISLDASVMIGLQANQEQQQIGVVEIHLMKYRGFDTHMDENHFICNWDLETMDFSQITASSGVQPPSVGWSA